jgi:hypothetical protein
MNNPKFQIPNSPSAEQAGKMNPNLKCQNYKKFSHLNFVIWISFVICVLALIISSVYTKDKELVLIYTGETHAMLYHCNCPVEPDGGVARRATLIKQLRKEYPDVLVLDSGNFFSAGPLDQNTQNTQLDMQRAKISLSAMESMKYDAVNISNDEFNFGKDFLSENINKTKLDFVSSNLSLGTVKPYVVRNVAGIKVGIIGLTNLAAERRSPDLKLIDPKQAVESSVRELKKQKVKLIILLSNLGEQEDLKIIGGVPGISVLIDGHGRGNTISDSFGKAGDTVILRANWQGRRLGKAVLGIRGDKIKKFKVEELRLSDKIGDEPSILSILPRCFSATECKKEGFIGICRNPGLYNAECSFSKAAKINLTVITTKDCLVCNPEPAISFLKKQFPGLETSYLYYPDKKAAKLFEDSKAIGLPVFLLGKEIFKEENFDKLKTKFIERDNFYLLKPEVAGIGYLVNRQGIKGKFDLFISLFGKNTLEVLNVVREFNPALHFLAVMDGNKIETMNGDAEIEEDLRAVCVQKYYPDRFWDYITCRVKNIGSSWWDDCAVKIDLNKIKSCARGQEGLALLRNNISLAKESKIMFGPTYLIDNQQIFSSKGAPAKKELKRLLKNR